MRGLFTLALSLLLAIAAGSMCPPSHSAPNQEITQAALPRKNPETIKVNHVARGRSEEYAHRFLDSIKDYQQAIRLDPTRNWLYKDCALCYLKLDRPADVIHANSLAMGLAPELAAQNFGLNTYSYYFVGGKPDANFEQCNRALALDPDCVEALNYRAFTYNAIGQFDKSIADYTTLLRSHPDLVWLTRVEHKITKL